MQPGEQEAVDETIVVPVEPVALVKAGIKKRKTEAGIDKPGPVEM